MCNIRGDSHSDSLQIEQTTYGPAGGLLKNSNSIAPSYIGVNYVTSSHNTIVIAFQIRSTSTHIITSLKITFVKFYVVL